MVHLVNEILHLHNYSWRDIKLSQMAELYVAMMIKTLGLSLIGIFIPIYLYDLGFSLVEISTFFVINYGFRIGWDFVTAWLVGYFGPKHMIMLSHIFLITTLGLLVALETFAVPLWVIALMNSFAYSFFFIAYHVEFSKLQSAKKGGAQIGKMQQLGKLAGALGPILGGVLAASYGFSAVLVAAIALIIVSAVPLLQSAEPVRTKQHVTFKGFPWAKALPGGIANMSAGSMQMVSLFYWPLFVALFVFSKDVFVSIGLITSLGLLTSFFAAKVFGRFIDDGKSPMLFKSGIVLSSLLTLGRGFVSSTPLVYLVNFVSEPAGLAYGMTYAKQIYQEASAYEGYRNIYIAVIVVAANIARAASWLLLLVLSIHLGDKAALQLSFLLAAVVLPFIFTHKYKDLK